MRHVDMTRDEAEALQTDIAILPLGSFEQHGPHLPLGTDTFQVEAVADGTAKRLGAFLLPAQPITTCYEHHGKRGSIHFSADVFFKFLVNIIDRLYKQGFRKVVILCGHGGVFILDPAIRHLNFHNPDLHAISLDPYGNLWAPDSPLSDNRNLHACEMETSLMLHLHPELVEMNKAVDFIPVQPRAYLNYGSIFTLSPSGVWGFATRGSAEKGKWILENAINFSVKQITDTFAAITDTDYRGNVIAKERK
jgi:creatinine amidohydrolase